MMLARVIGWIFAGACLVQAGLPFAIAKSTSGQVKVTPYKSKSIELKPADLLSSGSRVETGKESKASLRLQDDQSTVELNPNSNLRLKLVKREGKVLRKMVLDRGQIAVNMRSKGQGALVENAQTVAHVKAARFSFATDDQATATYIVLNGEITLVNHPKDKTALVHAGQKAVSDRNGIVITDASDSELEAVGLRENNLEIDFQNPETDEVSTLEIDYETHY
jgi:ferric-dicitrate binding protein FerR (iron transport regulator)